MEGYAGYLSRTSIYRSLFLRNGDLAPGVIGQTADPKEERGAIKMPLVSRIMIRCSLIYFGIGSLLGMLLLIHKAFPLGAGIWTLLPVHIEFMLFGWIIQLTLGVAYWILPRYLEGPPRGKENLALLMPAGLNIGIILMITAEWADLHSSLKVIGRTAQLLTVIVFIRLHWNRIVTYNKN